MADLEPEQAVDQRRHGDVGEVETADLGGSEQPDLRQGERQRRVSPDAWIGGFPCGDVQAAGGVQAEHRR
jgi:site-specific DNA-cytosine methylase